jgi:hypothetical protein
MRQSEASSVNRFTEKRIRFCRFIDFHMPQFLLLVAMLFCGQEYCVSSVVFAAPPVDVPSKESETAAALLRAYPKTEPKSAASVEHDRSITCSSHGGEYELRLV